MIPYENLKRLNQPFEADLKTAFDEVLASGHYILGGKLEQFESEFAAYLDMPHCIGVSNGLDALILGLRALNLPPGSGVIAPANTYVASILAIVEAGLTPILVEPDLGSYNLDPQTLEDAIGPNVRAIMVVHLYGKVCDMEPICEIAKRHGLYLIEDCAQAHGARYKGQLAGTFGDIAAFSFYPTKNLGALGDAGCVVCRDTDLRDSLRRMRNYGSDRKYYNDVLGWNNRLDEMQAAFLSVKLKGLDAMNSHRNKLAALYRAGLSSKFVLPMADADHYDVFHIFNIRHAQRDRLQKYLADHGVGTVIHYPVPPHRQKALAHLFEGLEFPITDEIHQTTLSIPCSFCHTEQEISEVIEILNRF